MEYLGDQTDEQWNDTIFKILFYISIDKSPEEKKKIAQVLEIINNKPF